jgi:hypothetical protein
VKVCAGGRRGGTECYPMTGDSGAAVEARQGRRKFPLGGRLWLDVSCLVMRHLTHIFIGGAKYWMIT